MGARGQSLKEHGDYIVGESGQTVLFSGRGPFNDETLLVGAREMNRIIVKISKAGPWGQLSYLSGESLMTPSTFDSFVKRTAERKAMGMRALAVVITDSNIVNTIKTQLSQAYLLADIDHQFFSDINEAIAWLQTRDIKLDSAQILDFFKKHAFASHSDDY